MVHSGAAMTPGNALASWGGAQPPPERLFGPGSEVFKVSTKAFYVGQGRNGPALFFKRGNAAPQELVEGVESMQVLYGLDNDGDNQPDTYTTADQVPDFTMVVTVKISLLLRTTKDLQHRANNNTATYSLLSPQGAGSATIINPIDDKRSRFVMTTTIKLRNRAFSL